MSQSKGRKGTLISKDSTRKNLVPENPGAYRYPMNPDDSHHTTMP